jgi:hypothetical protein
MLKSVIHKKAVLLHGFFYLLVASVKKRVQNKVMRMHDFISLRDIQFAPFSA